MSVESVDLMMLVVLCVIVAVYIAVHPHRGEYERDDDGA